jgi:hypothetical protein
MRLFIKRFFLGLGILLIAYLSVADASLINDSANKNKNVGQKPSNPSMPKLPATTTPSPNPAMSSVPTNRSLKPKPGCSTSEIPYKSINKDDPNMALGKKYIITGYNGQSMTCNNGETFSYQPIDEIVYIGTRVDTVLPPTTPPPTQSTQSQSYYHQTALNNCARLAGTSAYSTCLQAYGNNFNQ